MRLVYKIVLTLLFLSTTSLVHAQISIPQSQLSDFFGEVVEITTYTFDASEDASSIINASGANQTWDFSGFAITDTFSISESYVTLPADLVGSDQFPAATFGISVTSDSFTVVAGDDAAFLRYHSFEGDNYLLHGAVLLGDGDMDDVADTVVLAFDPPSLEAVFPIEYEKTWSDSTSQSIQAAGQSFIQFTETSESIVDGWGMLITPNITTEALRVRSEVTQTTVFPLGTQIITTELQFIGIGVIASIILDQSGSIIDISYGTRDDNSSTAIDDEGTVPQSFQLSQNYPNPFNPETTISYSLPATSDVTLKIFTITGQEIGTLVQSTQTAGSYEVQFNANELASGLYLYSLQTESFTQTRLMSLIK